MSELKGPGGELRATVHVTRKKTGKVETYYLVGHASPEEHAVILEEIKAGRLRLGPVEHGSAGALAGRGATMNEQENDDGRNS